MILGQCCDLPYKELESVAGPLLLLSMQDKGIFIMGPTGLLLTSQASGHSGPIKVPYITIADCPGLVYLAFHVRVGTLGPTQLPVLTSLDSTLCMNTTLVRV